MAPRLFPTSGLIPATCIGILFLLLISSATGDPCPDPIVGGTSPSNIHWDQVTPNVYFEWMDVNKWRTSYHPGSAQGDRMIIAAGDKVNVQCPTTYMDGRQGTRLDQRSGSRINVYTSLWFGSWYTIKRNAWMILHPSSTLYVGSTLTSSVTSHIHLSVNTSLAVANTMSMIDSDLTVSGGAVQAGSFSFSRSTVDLKPESFPSSLTTPGGLTFTGDPVSGRDTWTVHANANAQVQVGSDASFATAQIDFGQGNSAGSSLAVTGSLAFTGSTMKGNVNMQAGSISLDTTTVDVVFDTTGFSHPWIVTGGGSFTHTNSVLNIDASSYVPPSGGASFPLISCSGSCSTVESFAAQDIVLSGMSGSHDTKIVTDNTGVTLEVLPASQSPLAETISGEFTLDVGTTAMPYVPSCSGCKNMRIDTTSTLVINGTNYVGGPGTIVLFDTTGIAADGHTRSYSIDGTFDRVKVRDFPDGLWFELKYEASQILLDIKALNDYEDYVSRGSYIVDEYEPQDLTFWGHNFSWDKVPIWNNVRKNQNYTEDEIDRISKYQIIMTGISPAGYTYNEEGASHLAARVKAKGTNTKILWYWNSYNAWSPYEAYNDFNWDEWCLKDLTSGECLRDDGYGAGRRYYNASVPEMREWWVRSCMDFMTSSRGQHFDGVFIDSVAWMRESVHPDQYQMVMDLEEALANNATTANKLMIGNALRQHQHNGGRDKLHFMDGSYMEGWRGLLGSQPKWQGLAATIQLAREATYKGKIIMLNADPWGCGGTWPCPNKPSSREEMEAGLPNNMAVFLMMAEENAYLRYAEHPLIQATTWIWDTHDFELLNKPLGKPLGPPILIGTVMSREFEHLSVKMDLDLDVNATTFEF